MTDVITAVRATDPYPYYDRLRRERPFHHDPGLGGWVAADAAAVRAVFADEAFGVRPADQPVPAGLAGTPAGDVFGALVRMTDGSDQATLKPVVGAALSRADAGTAASVARRRTREVLDTGSADALSRLLGEVPVGVVGELCGLAPEVDVGAATAAFVSGLPPTATEPEQQRAASAATRLSELLGPALETGRGLAGELAAAARAAGVPVDARVLANAIGLLSQTYDATAGLIGNTLMAWRRDPRQVVGADFVLEVARHDAPVQNTRRFAHADTTVLGTPVRSGDAVLLVLAAANRDPAVNPEPERFRPGRRSPVLFTFGLGRHACPGRALAVVVATAVIGEAIDAGLRPDRLPSEPTYRPLANARIPEL
jgi:cytochrome P450